MKVLAAPFVLLLAVVVGVLKLIVGLSSLVLGLFAALLLLMAFPVLFSMSVAGGLVLIVLAFLISPIGIALVVQVGEGDQGSQLASDGSIAGGAGEGAAEDSVPVLVHQRGDVDGEGEVDRVDEAAQRQDGGGHRPVDADARRGPPVPLVDQVCAVQRRHEFRRGPGGLG